MNTSMLDTPVVKQLNLDDVPKGTIARFWVQLIKNGLGEPVKVPVMIARGKSDGPVLGLTAAVHGNELNGLPIVQKVFQYVDISKLKGTLVGVPVVNIPGYLLNQRYFNDGIDLNRIMPGKEDGNMSEIYAHRFVNRIACNFEYLIDLHTASFGRINSYYIRADMDDPITAKMASLQNAEIIVNNTGPDTTLRGSMTELGIHAITVEAGNPHTFQKGMIRSAITGTLNVMRHLDMINEEIVVPDHPSVLCKKSYWIYTIGGGVLEIFPSVTEIVEAGDRIARVRNIFGDVTREYFAPETGIVIGKSVNPLNQTGSRILHLGILK